MTPATQTEDQPRNAVDPLDPGRLAEELVRIGRTAIAKPDDAALDGFFTENFEFHGPAGDSGAVRGSVARAARTLGVDPPHARGSLIGISAGCTPDLLVEVGAMAVLD